jgi:hypothetical protein
MQNSGNVRMFLFLYVNAPEKLSTFISEIIQKTQLSSILIGTYKENPTIRDIHERLLSEIEKRDSKQALGQIEDLRAMYEHYGEKPTINDSGYYNMLRLLDEIGEFIQITRHEWKS